MRDKIIFLTIIFLLGISIIPGNPFFSVNWAIITALILALSILAFFWRFETQNVSAKEIALIATMATLAAVSRVPFAVIMSVQPTTFMAMITGCVFGMQTGFMVGALAALVSNFFLGQGPWTPWQMFCWGMCGVSAALLTGRNSRFNLRNFTILAAFWGYLFGWIMNIWHWVGFVYPLTWKTFLATYLASFPFDTLHALGNIVFSLMFGKTFYRVLWRFKKRITVIDLGKTK